MASSQLESDAIQRYSMFEAQDTERGAFDVIFQFEDRVILLIHNFEALLSDSQCFGFLLR